MPFKTFTELYEKDVRPKLKENTWLTKEHIIKTKILPYFEHKRLCDISAKDVIAWQNEIRKQTNSIKSILGDDAIDIQHIGSTAIPAIKAKPIIDIVVGVTDFDKVMLHNEQLRQVGIFYRGSDVERQLLYVMGDMENDTRTHHIHIVKWNGTEWKNYIHFRDYLKANENMALQYEKLKEEMEHKYADDRVAYTNGKQNMINKILGK